MAWYKIFCQLIRRDLIVFKKIYAGKLIDTLITFSTWVFVFGYFVPDQGTEKSYGLFIMIGAIVSFALFDLIGQASTLINDIQGDRTISHKLLLPISSGTVFCSFAISWAIQSSMISFPLYFVGKAIFWEQFNLQNISWLKTFFAFVSVNVFFGFFALWITAMLHKVVDLSRIYFRFLSPLFILGCYFYSWKVSFSISHIVGYIVLFDPLSYTMEISRAAIMGQEGFIPFWVSAGALWGYSLLFWYFGSRKLKKVLDCL